MAHAKTIRVNAQVNVRLAAMAIVWMTRVNAQLVRFVMTAIAIASK
jgi:hypothetical protein